MYTAYRINLPELKNAIAIYPAEIGLSKLPEDSLDMTIVGNHL